MHKFSRFFVSLLFVGLFTTYTPVTMADDQPESSNYGSKVGNKALNGFANITTSTLEIPKNIINTTNDSNIIYGITGGLLKGVINTIGRVAVGVTDIITFPIPTKPIAQSAYIWDGFDDDTTYGPVFRLDQSKSPAVQAPVVEPVVAVPAVAAPRPEPIDNSKQYNQETSHSLDTMFKKEMMK
ncbi:MAG: exosortase system-associated protein, TIGR04073 family [Methylobacter sp.]|nr:exosortase system-associated protein, TIGR04073 family [Methylobacter sp.]